ncbi:MAG: alpha/beta hydrolase [Candidatus Paceibacterota bacterium]|jgi:pimeloyl-ACP methyl ester carboxylesterase
MEIQNRKISVNEIDVNYIEVGQGEALVILHGWGANISYWSSVIKNLANDYKVIALDLPGFGATSTPETIWSSKEYIDFLLNFFEKINLDNFNIIGHSFGGALALKLAIEHQEKVKKIILCDPAVIRGERLSLRQKISKFIADLAPNYLKKLPFYGFAEKAVYRLAGVSDYYKANPIMREIFKKVISEDMTHLASRLKKPCLLVWGENDKATPLSDAFTLKDLIVDSDLKIIKGVGHNPYRKEPEQFIKAVSDFLKK